MLIQFRVGNYRSIREPQSLSLVASADQLLSEANLIGQPQDKLRLVRQSVIYGPNAAGKSTVLMAMEALRSLVFLSANLQEGQQLPWIVPFRLDAESEQEPTVFEIIFVVEDVRYEYTISATSSRVTHERFVAWPQGRAQRWFERTFDSEIGKDVWWFGPHFRGGHNQRITYQAHTRSNALFLSAAVQLNNEQLRPAFRWLTQQFIVVVPGKVNFNPTLTIDLLKSSEGNNRLIEFLRSADIGIDRLNLEESDSLFPQQSGPQMKAPFLPIFSPPASAQAGGQIQIKWGRVVTWHKGSDGKEISFDLGEESEGTRKLFELAGGWIKALDIGATLCIDEIELSLHPYITRLLVSLFRADSNKRNAQLIFTTHDTNLLDTDLLRRDQIWFVEKNKHSATELYSLLEYSPRKNESLERGYLLGRYGAIPFLSEPSW